MTRSMTAFSSQKGSEAGFFWSWELRSVNGKGLDLRLRVPDWVPGLEAALRARLGKALARGNVTLNLRLSREETGGTLRVNEGQLASVLEALRVVEQAAQVEGVALAPTSGADLLGLRGVLETSAAEQEVEGLTERLLSDFEPVLADFLAMRDREGALICDVLRAQVAQIDALTEQAATLSAARTERMAEAVDRALTRIIKAGGQDQQRIEQELAMIAIKADVTEELDRLRAHVFSARDLLTQQGMVGRKLDFLTQEFNREANTLCSKAQDAELTTLGLELKAVIDQLREQVQNIE